MFRDRRDAGERLAQAVLPLVPDPAVVLGIPRGGVIVAAPVAAALGAPLDVVLTHKLGAPGNPELAIGAVAPGVRVVNDRTLRALGVDAAYLDDEVARQEEELTRRAAAYRAGRTSAPVEGRIAIVVDDGVATGATAVAALRWARAQGAAGVVFAAPVGPEGIEQQLGQDCDASVILGDPAEHARRRRLVPSVRPDDGCGGHGCAAERTVVRVAELALSVVLAGFGLRSLIHWIRRPFDGADPIDHALFAGFVLGRVGTWWAFAGLFAISATLKDPNGTGAYLEGRAFADTFRDQYSWYLLVLIAFPVLQFLSGYFLGRRRPS